MPKLSKLFGMGNGELSADTFLDKDQNDEMIIQHVADTNNARQVQIKEYVVGATGIVNNDIDFDLVDESEFIQEDATNGTDFVDGDVTLHDSGGSIYATWNPLDSDEFMRENREEITVKHTQRRPRAGSPCVSFLNHDGKIAKNEPLAPNPSSARLIIMNAK